MLPSKRMMLCAAANDVANFDTYSGERFKVLAAAETVAGSPIVQSRLIPASGKSVAINYVMHQADGHWTESSPRCC